MKAIIIGAGIAGLGAAIALRKAGWQVKVYEAAPELKPVGAGISLAPNATMVLKQWGLDQDCIARGAVADEIAICDHQLRNISTTSTLAMAERMGSGFLMIHRAELQAALLSALPDLELLLHHRPKDIRQLSDCIQVEFENGTIDQAELLIGADGIHSGVRECLFPGHPTRYAGYTCWRGITSFQMPFQPSLMFEAWGGRLRFGCTPVGDGKVYYFAVEVTEEGGKDDPQKPINEVLAEKFGQFADPVPTLLRQTAPSDIIRNDIIDLAPLRHWHKGRVLLIGDAAHATTPNLGQGGCQALEDAFVLGKLMEKQMALPETLTQFEQLRKKRAHMIVKQSLAFGKMAHWTRFQGLRNWLLRSVPAGLTARQTDKIFRLPYL